MLPRSVVTKSTRYGLSFVGRAMTVYTPEESRKKMLAARMLEETWRLRHKAGPAHWVREAKAKAEAAEMVEAHAALDTVSNAIKETLGFLRKEDDRAKMFEELAHRFRAIARMDEPGHEDLLGYPSQSDPEEGK